MKRFKWTMILLAVPALALGCPEPAEPEPEMEPFAEDERPVEPEPEHELTEEQKRDRQAYIDRVESELAMLEEQIDRLEDRLGDAEEQVRTDVQPRVDALRGHIDDTKTMYENWDEMTEQAFGDIRQDLNERLEEARRTYEELNESVDEAIIAPAGG